MWGKRRWLDAERKISMPVIVMALWIAGTVVIWWAVLVWTGGK